MTGPFWIITFIYAAGCHLSSPSPVSLSPLVVHLGQNVSLACNITSSSEIIWYLLRSEQLLPLLKLSIPKLKGKAEVGNFYGVNSSRFNWARDQSSSRVSLEILSVEEEDAGWYFCTGVSGADVCVNRGLHLKVKGVGVDSAGENVWQPCWSFGICILPASLAFGFCAMMGFYLCSGKLVGCCCTPLSSTFRVTEEEDLHYSSLRYPDKPRPLGRGGHGLVAEPVTYSTVTTRKHVTGSPDNN